MGQPRVPENKVAGILRKAGFLLAERFAGPRPRIVGATAAVILLVAFGVAFRPRPTEIPVQGLVLAVEARDILDEKSGLPFCRVRIVVGDTTETTLLLPPPVPDVGHFIPLRESHSPFGKDGYRLDEKAWRTVGPS